jgi:hypothetical protein
MSQHGDSISVVYEFAAKSARKYGISKPWSSCVKKTPCGTALIGVYILPALAIPFLTKVCIMDFRFSYVYEPPPITNLAMSFPAQL